MSNASRNTQPTAAELGALADVLGAELDGWRQERAVLDARIARRERLVADLHGEAEAASRHLFQPPARKPEPDAIAYQDRSGRPQGTGDAIVAVLQAATAPLSAREVYAALERQGWLPAADKPRNAVRTALWNLANRGRIDKLGDSPATRRWAAKTSSPNGNGREGDEGP